MLHSEDSVGDVSLACLLSSSVSYCFLLECLQQIHCKNTIADMSQSSSCQLQQRLFTTGRREPLIVKVKHAA